MDEEISFVSKLEILLASWMPAALPEPVSNWASVRSAHTALAGDRYALSALSP